ncbi:serine protease 42-like [Drosophila rhopaloa]|uniref:Peptidase S1 domain-containing protein n=1 Tax=Drosophila rhopaloa TaxID=1041015 RepID=A0ABM5J6D3_DRORH|nr:serine protease 42-like [Drosophila rhopaloa]
MFQLSVFGFLITLLKASYITAQILPYIACPNLFRYLKLNDVYIGHLKLVLDKDYAENVVRVELSQPGRSTPGKTGSLTIVENAELLKDRLRNNEAITYRIDFPSPDVVPKLTKVTVNTNIVCQAQPFRSPSTRLSLSRTLRVIGSLALPRKWSQNSQKAGPSQNQERPQRLRQQQPPQVPRLLPPVRNTGSVPRTIGQLSGVCGREKSIHTPFIHNGIEVERGQLPWMAALFEHVGRVYNFLCGGTLISARTVITAAHCFRLGSHNLSSERTMVSLGRNSLDIFTPGLISGVSLVLLHRDYNPNVYTDADLALLQLTKQIKFNDYVRPICLWNKNFLLNLPSGYKSYVAGWGEDKRGNPNTQLARITDTDIITFSECRGNLSEVSARFITSHTICASNSKASGPCSGDSGGGLMLQERERWILRGVISGGQRMIRRCNLKLPVIYTDVAKHIAWILRSMWF